MHSKSVLFFDIKHELISLTNFSCTRACSKDFPKYSVKKKVFKCYKTTAISGVIPFVGISFFTHVAL